MSATLTSISATPATETKDPFLFRRARTWWLLLALLLMAQENGIFTVARSVPSKMLKTVSQTYESSTPRLLMTVALCTISAGLVLTRMTPTLRVMLNQKAVLAFAFLCLISTLWSQDPLLTFRRAFLLIPVFFFAWFFAACYAPIDQMRLFVTAGMILAFASIAMAVLLPQYGLDTGGEWKGVFGQKNHLGLAMVFLFSGLPFRHMSSRRGLLAVTIQAILPLGLLLLSRSKTSFLLAVLLMAMRSFGPYIARRRRDQFPFVVYGSIIGILAIVFGRDIVLSLLGRDSTLTGRTHEWAILLPFALQHLWLGYGYQGFWTGTGDSLLAMKLVGAAMHGSDSGYVDIMLELGLLGVGMMLALVLVFVRDCLRVLRTDSASLLAYWYSSIILATFLGSVTESLISGSGGVVIFAFVVAYAGLRKLTDKNGVNSASHAAL